MLGEEFEVRKDFNKLRFQAEEKFAGQRQKRTPFQPKGLHEQCLQIRDSLVQIVGTILPGRSKFMHSTCRLNSKGSSGWLECAQRGDGKGRQTIWQKADWKGLFRVYS